MDLQALFPIIHRLQKNKITYALGGSGLLYYLHLIDSVNDWDLTVECSKETLIKAIEGYDWAEQSSGDYPFASQYRISIASANIDIIGSFALYSEGQVLNLPVNQSGQWDGINIGSPEVWYVAYYLMGRRAKADLLLSYLKKHNDKINVNLISDLLKTKCLNHELSQELEMLMQ